VPQLQPSPSELVAARKAGLRYVNGDAPGLHRIKKRNTVRYLNPRRRPVTDPETLRRIKSLVIPPAWTNVWICPDPDGHLQATGYDVKGRKQYRYHPDWRRARDETKYERMLHLAAALPRIRRRVRHDLRQPGLGRDKVIAAIVRLLDLSAARIGNEQYVKENGSFGLTTLRNRHAHVNGSRIELDFKGKASQHQHLIVDHPVLSRIVRKCQHLPGQTLFEYVDHDKTVHRIASDDVNRYIAETVGGEFTSKDFRTWKATVIALKQLQEFPPCEAIRTRKSNLVRAIECVAANLGNTPAICKKCYIHPVILERYLDGTLFDNNKRGPKRARPSRWFSEDEQKLVVFLKRIAMALRS
jgi:DNA topoisomerase I